MRCASNINIHKKYKSNKLGSVPIISISPRLQNVTPEWNVYANLGDNEVLARVEGINNPRTNNPANDWSKGGKQWDH